MESAMILARKFFSLDTLIYAAILFVALVAFLRCVLPVASVSRRIRKATRVIITESKQQKERKAWRDLNFLGEKLEAVWADFLQNSELREAHGDTCDVSLYVNEESVLYAVGSVELVDLVPGVLTSLGILGTFLGLVRGLSGLSLNAADTNALLGAMEQLIGGMSTAFLTSIAGISASLLFNLLSNHTMTKTRKATDRFCEVFNLYAMPKPVSEETTMLVLQQEQTTYMRQAAQDIGEKLSSQMEASIMRAMLPVQRSMDNFVLAATKAQVEGVDRIVQLFLKRMTALMDQEIQGLRQSFTEAGIQQDQSNRQMAAAEDAIAEMARDVINMQQMTQGLLEHFQAYVAQMEQSRASSDEVLRQVTEMTRIIEENAKKEAELLDRMIAQQGSQERDNFLLAKTTQEFMDSANHMAKAASDEIRRMTEKMVAGAETIEEAGVHLDERMERLRAVSGRQPETGEHET